RGAPGRATWRSRSAPAMSTASPRSCSPGSRLPVDVRIDRDVPLARYTTLGTGGLARAFAKPESGEGLPETLRWAAERDLAVAVVGLGSNLLVADDGVDALVLRLAGELAAARADDGTLSAGGGAPLAVCLHRARAAGLGGIEFACAIPGTVGGGVR